MRATVPAWQPYRRPRTDWTVVPRRLGRAVRWAGKAPADRLTIPAAVALYGGGAVLHGTGIPAMDVAVIGGIGIPAVTFGAVNHRSHKHRKDHPDTDPLARAGKAAFGMMMAGMWAAAAARWGVLAGPWDLSSVLYFTGTALGYGFLRYDEVNRGKRDWRNEKVRWHQVSKLYGLQGSHLERSEQTRLGRRMLIDTTGTGKRASAIGRDTAERIAEHKRLPAVRVQVHPDRIAGRVWISIRERDPWADPIPHPVLDGQPEIELPETQSITDPLTLGQDPESARPLDLDAYDPEDFGARAILIVAARGGGKTVLLNNLRERLTACRDVVIWDINLSKAKENRRWAPACDLVAHGPDAKRDALAILRMARKAIEYRGNVNTDDAIHQPSPSSPAIVVIVDEGKALLGDAAIRDEMVRLNEAGRSEGIVTVIASQRGTGSHGTNTDLRANVDTFMLARVRSRTEMMHAAGEVGMELPDMASYGEGHPGVWLIGTHGGEHQTGRTFLLKHLDDISAIADARPPRATLEPGLREHLGDMYERIKNGRAVARAPGDGDEKVPDWMKDIAKDLEPETTDIFEQMDQLAAQNTETRRMLAELDSQDLTELGPEHDAALAASARERQKQAAEKIEIPGDHRSKILKLAAGDGVPMRDLIAALGVPKTGVWRYLYRLRVEGVIEKRGKGRASRWHLTGDHAPAESFQDDPPRND
jgi:hypothetical protein